MATSNDKNFSGYWLKIAGTSTVVLVTIIISMTSFWMMIGKDFVTRDETRIIIGQQTKPIENGLESVGRALQKNTDAIVDLKLSLTALSNLEAMDKRLNYLESEVKTVREEQLRSSSTLNSVHEIKNEIKDIRVEISHIKSSLQAR